MATSGRLGGFYLMHSNISTQYLSADEINLIKNLLSGNTSATAQILLAKLSNYNKWHFFKGTIFAKRVHIENLLVCIICAI